MGQGYLEENETKKKYLKSYQESVRREKEILEEIQRLRMDKMFPSVVNDGMPKGSHQSDLSDYMVLIDEQIERLKQERLKRQQINDRIDLAIRRMEEPEEQRVLRLRYIQGLKWEEVAVKMGCDPRQARRIHGRALNNFKMS